MRPVPRSVSVTLVATSFLLALTSCYKQDHADWGDPTIDGGGSGGGGTGGVTEEDGGESDTDTDVEDAGDSNPGECEPDEVLEPETDLCWLRCPLGQEWVDSTCVGAVSFMAWSSAVSACQAFDDRMRTATRDDMISVLDNCDYNVVQADGDGLCDPCIQSSPCFEMFDFDSNIYWTSTSTSRNLFSEPLPWAVSFDVGTVFQTVNTEELYAARCVRDLD
jgi:hypothetical protein